MGRSNYVARGDYADQWYIDYDGYYTPGIDEQGEETEESFFDDDLMNEDISAIMAEIEKRFPSFRHCDKWGNYYEGRENHFLLENSMFYVGIADNGWSMAIFIQGKDEDISWNGLQGLAGKHFSNYAEGIKTVLLQMFGAIYTSHGGWTSTKLTA